MIIKEKNQNFLEHFSLKFLDVLLRYRPLIKISKFNQNGLKCRSQNVFKKFKPKNLP